MIDLFHLNTYQVDISNYSNMLHDDVVIEFENEIKKYVGAKYAVTFNSATSAIFLALMNKKVKIKVPSMIPPVVLNAIITSGNKYEFKDDVDWVGDSYVLHEFDNYKIVDSAQKLEKDQFINECNDNDLMVFSFYPTKPVGTFDGGMIVSNDEERINRLKEMALNGMTYSHNNWDRKIKFPGYKMYMNSFQADIALRNFRQYEYKLNRLSEIRKHYNHVLGYKNTSNHLYRISVPNREKFIEFMKEKGICCGVHYEASHLNPVYAIEGSNCPKSESESKKTVSIPFNEKLSALKVNYIAENVKYYLKIISEGNFKINNI
jgi:dTDP-4-amino-4,6-dideoxygalactose transaminase